MMRKQKTILYVDDDPDDREFLTEAIKDVSSDVEVICAENGIKALQYLGELKTLDSGLPCLIVLDINMPFLDGKETFRELKKDPFLKAVPIMIFTSSERPNDKKLFDALGVKFITKPNNSLYLNLIAEEMIVACC